MAEHGPAVAGQAINCGDSIAADDVLSDSTPSLRVLLTGATSQIGYALLPMLRAQRHHVTALSRDVRASGTDGVSWHRGDLEKGWPDVEAADVIVSFGPMQALADALSGLSSAPVGRLVATSSMSAESKRDAAVEEDRALSAALRAAESALIAQCERLGIGWTVLRPTMIYGLGLDENLSPIARRALRTRLFPYPKGRGLRQPVHAEDVALAAWRALGTPAAQGRIIEIGGGERLRIDEMFRRVRDDLPVWTVPLALPHACMRVMGVVMPRLRGALSRVDTDLVADNRELEAVIGMQPRSFSPDVACWLEARP